MFLSSCRVHGTCRYFANLQAGYSFTSICDLPAPSQPFSNEGVENTAGREPYRRKTNAGNSTPVHTHVFSIAGSELVLFFMRKTCTVDKSYVGTSLSGCLKILAAANLEETGKNEGG